MLHKTMVESAYYFSSLIDIIEKTTELSKIAINIGANDGIELDMLFPLFIDKKFDGLCIEYDKALFSELCKNIPDKVNKINEYITPWTILPLINKYINKPIDAISIDIDSFDYFITQKVLLLKPKILIVELNENIPPGINFAVLYEPNYNYLEHKLYGCSLDMIISLGDKFGYKLLKMEWNNAILIRDDLSHLFDLPKSNNEAYSVGYYFRENREKVFWWKKEEATLFEKSTHEAFEILKKQIYAAYLDKIILELNTMKVEK